MPDLKSIFAVNLPLKHFRAGVVSLDTGSLQSLHTLFETNLNHMLVKFEPNRMGQKCTNFFLTKTEFFKSVFEKALTPSCMTFCS